VDHRGDATLEPHGQRRLHARRHPEADAGHVPPLEEGVGEEQRHHQRRGACAQRVPDHTHRKVARRGQQRGTRAVLVEQEARRAANILGCVSEPSQRVSSEHTICHRRIELKGALHRGRGRQRRDRIHAYAVPAPLACQRTSEATLGPLHTGIRRQLCLALETGFRGRQKERTVTILKRPEARTSQTMKRA